MVVAGLLPELLLLVVAVVLDFEQLRAAMDCLLQGPSQDYITFLDVFLGAAGG